MTPSPKGEASKAAGAKRAPHEQRSEAGQRSALGLGGTNQARLSLKQDWSRIVPAFERQKGGPKAVLSFVVIDGYVVAAQHGDRFFG